MSYFQAPGLPAKKFILYNKRRSLIKRVWYTIWFLASIFSFESVQIMWQSVHILLLADDVVYCGIFTSERRRFQIVMHKDLKKKYTYPAVFLVDTITGEYYKIADGNLL